MHYLKNELINWVDFFLADANSGKLKITFIFSWVGIIKSGCGFLDHGTLKYAVSPKWIDEFSWFLCADTKLEKLKVTLIKVKNRHCFLVYMTWRSAMMNWVDNLHAERNWWKLKVTCIFGQATGKMDLAF